LWRMKNDAFQSPNCFGAQAEWAMVVGGRREVAFQFESIHMALFRIGVGFLTVEASPKCGAVEDWLDFLHYFRFAGGQRGVKIKAQRRTGKDQHEPYFPPLAGGTEKHPEGGGALMEIVGALLETAKREGERKEWRREVFIPGQLIPFASLYVDGEMNEQGEGITALLYRIRNFFPAHREIAPSPEDSRLDHPSLLSYADKMWFVFAQEGGAFVAFNAPRTDFFRRELPNHLRDQYSLLFLLALHQKFALMSLSQDVSEHWLKGDFEERLRSFERIRNDILDFTARGYFVQVMQRDHHHRVYRKWQEIFQLERLYREVSDEVREMHEYLLSEQTRRLEQRVNILSTYIAIPALITSFLSINLFGITAKAEGLPFWLALAIFMLSVFPLGFLANLALQKWVEKRIKK